MQPNACIWLYPSRSIDAEGVNNTQRLLNNFEYLVIVKEAMHTSASPLFIVTLYTVTGQILQPIPAQGRDDIATRTALDPSRPMVAQDDEGE